MSPPTRRPRLTRAVGLAVGLAVVGLTVLAGVATAAVATIDGAASVPSERAERVAPPQPVVLIGDSSIAALRWVSGADNAIIGFEHTLDLESCRRLFRPSCRGREGRTPATVYEALLEHGDNYHTLIVAVGYNDGSTAIDEAFRAIVFRARGLGFSRIVWMTLRSDVDYVSPTEIGNHETFAASNQIVRDLLDAGAYPDVVLADWGGYTADRPGWFATDGVHFRAIGAWAASDYVSRKMAFLDERPCPLPVAPDESPDAPCPDPDLTGPVADIDALYPIGQDGVLCYEVGLDRQVECRYDTHVIQISRELRLDDTGADVEALQIRLNRLGYLEGTSAEFDEPTAQAVENFQRAYTGEPELSSTGDADRATLAALGFDVSAIDP